MKLEGVPAASAIYGDSSSGACQARKIFRSTSQAVIRHGGAIRTGPHQPTSFWASFRSHHSAKANAPNKITTAKKPSQFAMPPILPFKLNKYATHDASIAHFI
jgi:hypothetical protein